MGANGRNGTWHWVRLGVGVCITVASSALRGPTQLPSLRSDPGRPSARLSKVEHTEVGGTHWIALLGKEPRAVGTAEEAMPNQVETVGWLWSRVTFKLSGREFLRLSRASERVLRLSEHLPCKQA